MQKKAKKSKVSAGMDARSETVCTHLSHATTVQLLIRTSQTAFSTAVALAEYENDCDPKGKILFHVRYLEQVVKMPKAFQDYLKSTHGMNLEEQARRSRVRNDFWPGPKDLSGPPSAGR